MVSSFCFVGYNFNPRSHTGSDTDNGISETQYQISIHAPTRGATVCCSFPLIFPLFQSTLPHGERQYNFLLSVFSINFNPRSHTGSDSRISLLIFVHFISIHAPTRGATAILYKNFAYFHSYVTIINIHCISMHPFADA